MNSTAQLLFNYISALTLKRGYCYATDKHLAEEIRRSVRTVSRCIRELKRESLIRIESCTDGTRPYRAIYLTTPNLSTPHDKNVYTPTTKMAYGIDKNGVQKYKYNLKNKNNYYKNSAGARREGIIKKSYTADEINALFVNLDRDD